MGIKDGLNKAKEVVKGAIKEKDINQPDPDVHYKVQSDRVAPPITRALDKEDGKMKEVGNPDGGKEPDHFLDKYRDDPPTH